MDGGSTIVTANEKFVKENSLIVVLNAQV